MHKYDGIVREFFEKKHGEIFVVSDDALFFRTLRTTVQKLLAVRQGQVNHFQEPSAAIKRLRERAVRNVPIILFVERLLRGRPSTEFLMTIKKVFPETHLIVLTDETRKDNLIYLHEVGVNSIITKPASMDDLIVKIAFTLKPQGNLSQLVDNAKLFLAKEQWREAIQMSDKILEVKPESPIGLMLRGDAFLGLGREDEAVDAYEKAHKSSKLYLDPLKRLADFHRERNADKYLEILKKLDKLSPLNTERKFEIGKAHVRRQELEEAEAYFDGAIKTATQEVMNFVGNITKSIAGVLSGVSPELSEKYLKHFLSIKGDDLSLEDMEALNRLGIALRQQGKWRDAVDNYKTALRIAPTDEGIHYNLAMAYFDGNASWEAAGHLDKAMAINPELPRRSATTAYNMASIYSKAGAWQKAKVMCEAALQTDPEHQEASFLLSKVTQKL